MKSSLSDHQNISREMTLSMRRSLLALDMPGSHAIHFITVSMSVAKSKAVSFRVLLGQRLRALREEHKLPVETVAAIGRRYGLPWRRSVLTQLELGRRRLWAEELLLLGVVYSTALGRPLRWEEILPSGEGIVVGLNADLECPASALIDLMTAGSTQKTLTLVKRDQFQKELRALEKLGFRLYGRPADLAVINTVIAQQHDEAVVKAARKLGVSPLHIGLAAWWLWSKPLTVERDDRVATLIGETKPSPAKLKALRGHAMRELRQRLQTTLGVTPAPTQPRKPFRRRTRTHI
jgi:transcriptional regulator with XRE-family HTH domain